MSDVTKRNMFTGGYDLNDRFDKLEIEIEDRLKMYNLALGQVSMNNNNKINELSKKLEEIKKNTEFFNWYVKIPWYKKLWFGILGKDLINIYESYVKNKK